MYVCMYVFQIITNIEICEAILYGKEGGASDRSDKSKDDANGPFLLYALHIVMYVYIWNDKKIKNAIRWNVKLFLGKKIKKKKKKSIQFYLSCSFEFRGRKYIADP